MTAIEAIVLVMIVISGTVTLAENFFICLLRILTGRDGEKTLVELVFGTVIFIGLVSAFIYTVGNH